MVRLTRARAARCWALLLASACGSVPYLGDRAGSTGSQASVCHVRSQSFDTLRVDGEFIHVNPHAVAAAGDEILIVGMPNYLWRPINGEYWREVKKGQGIANAAQDSILGVIVDERSGTRIIVSPVRGTVAGLRARAAGAGTWHIAFGELDPDPSATGEPLWRLWFGTFDGTRWISLEEIPAPAGVPQPESSSPLVGGETIVWAMRVQSRGDRPALVAFERTGGGWRADTIPTRGGRPALTHQQPEGFLLAALEARADSAYLTDSNSLFLYERDTRWTEARRVTRGARDGRAHDPSLLTSSDGVVLTWLSEMPGAQHRDARAVVLRSLVDPVPAPLILDAAAVRFADAATEAAGPVWVIEHARGTGEPSELRFVRDSAGTAVQMMTMPNPYFGPFGAIGTPEGGLVTVGTQPVEDEATASPTVPPFVTLLVRSYLSCERTPLRT